MCSILNQPKRKKKRQGMNWLRFSLESKSCYFLCKLTIFFLGIFGRFFSTLFCVSNQILLVISNTRVISCRIRLVKDVGTDLEKHSVTFESIFEEKFDWCLCIFRILIQNIKIIAKAVKLLFKHQNIQNFASNHFRQLSSTKSNRFASNCFRLLS